MSNQDLHSSKEKLERTQNIANEKNVNNKIIDTEEESKIVDKNKIILIIVYIVSAIIIAFSFIYCVNIYKQDDDIQELTKNVQNCITENESESKTTRDGQSEFFVDFDKLKTINSDTVGWLRIDGLEINMPIVKTDDNNYYMKHSFDKSNNLSGWAFVDCRNKLDGSDKNVVIYGHNRRDDIIFSSLVNVLNPDWYNNEDNRHIIFIDQSGQIENYEIFSVYQIEAEDYYINTNFSSNDGFRNFLKTLEKRSIKNYNLDLNGESPILTLSTCGKNSKYRVVVHAVRN